MEQKLFKSSIILLFLTGVFWIIFSSVIYYEHIDITDAYTSFQTILILGIIFGSVLILWCTIGLNSNSHTANSMYYAYNIGVFIFVLVQIAALVFVIILANKIPDYKNDTVCTSEDILIQLSELNKKSFQTLCQADCKCDFEGTSDQAFKQGITNYNSIYQGAIRVQECEKFESFDLDDQETNSNILKAFEQTFQCSGFCSLNSYYVFSDVNNGIPDKDCKEEMIAFIENNNNRAIIATSIMTFVLIILFILSILQYFQQQQVCDIQLKNIELQVNN